MNVVFLHAFPLDARMWEPQHERFGGAAPDLYGLGSSLDEWAAAVLASVEGEVALIGASMGGYTALAASRLAPDRVRALALVGSRADADTPERREGRAETIRTIREGGVQALWEQMREKAFAPDAPAEALSRAREIALEQDPALLVRAVEAMRDRSDETETLRRFDGRLLVAVGDRDPFVSIDHFEAILPGRGLHVVAGGGHLLSMEHPELFDGLLEELLA